MFKKIFLFAVILIMASNISYGMGESPNMPKTKYAVFETSKGDITCVLYPDKAPETVANFIGLATGTKEWLDPVTGEKTKRPLYDGTIFHRVIPNFMIQGGDPLGSGYGGPGYQFKDEFDKSLDFSRPGMLAMANSGPDTNGSQFFITTVPTTWLNNIHTIFGKVMIGQEVIDAIYLVDRDMNDKPIEPIVIKKIAIKDSL
jgi:peptidyl-prolyl cis-trans isomerase A (cyclophilin A)